MFRRIFGLAEARVAQIACSLFRKQSAVNMISKLVDLLIPVSFLLRRLYMNLFAHFMKRVSMRFDGPYMLRKLKSHDEARLTED